ncbi:MAG: HAD family phosphatase [Deltaproteobacteria bacterium]|nr:HAD family phosphatase [Deltaproteobacteria bacterium]
MMKPSPIKAVVLDLGEVVVRLNFEKVLTAIGRAKDHSVEQAARLIGNRESYDQLERGLMDAKTFIGQFSRQHSMSETQFLELWHTVIVGTVDGIEPVLEEISRKLPLYALTNSNPIHMDYLTGSSPWLRYFIRVFTSFELGARKPEKDIFLSLVRILELSPQNILFIDDIPENVAAASGLGFRAHLCKKSPDDILLSLQKYNIIAEH